MQITQLRNATIVLEFEAQGKAVDFHPEVTH